MRRAARSRALPLPELSRPSVRSKSRTWESCARKLSSPPEFSMNVCTASCRRRIGSTAASGCESQLRSIRAPIGVTVRLTAP